MKDILLKISNWFNKRKERVKCWNIFSSVLLMTSVTTNEIGPLLAPLKSIVKGGRICSLSYLSFFTE